MILKMAGALPQYIYAYDDKGVYVNLFIGSEAKIPFKGSALYLKQTTDYPWKGNVRFEVNTGRPKELAISIRIPGWAQGRENPFGLYHSHVSTAVVLKVNGRKITSRPEKGYVSLLRTWKKGDVIELSLPMEPRLIRASDSVTTVKGKLAIAAGPVVFGLEATDNPDLDSLQIDAGLPLTLTYRSGLLSGVNVVMGKATNGAGQEMEFTAIPFYALGNRLQGAPYQVWLPERPR